MLALRIGLSVFLLLAAVVAASAAPPTTAPSRCSAIRASMICTTASAFAGGGTVGACGAPARRRSACDQRRRVGQLSDRLGQPEGRRLLAGWRRMDDPSPRNRTISNHHRRSNGFLVFDASLVN
jgi:hypothetical protein